MQTILDSPAYWDERYVNNDTTWDTKNFNPVLEKLFEENEFVRPGNLLVVGCGKGYDAVLAAKYGYKVTAVDFSRSAIESARNLAEKNSVNINFLIEDFFLIDESHYGKFDYAYEYVTYCAINPQRRKEFIEKIFLLLKPGGKLIADLFPVDGRADGPPFAINLKNFYKEASAYFKLALSTRKINSIKPRRGKEVLQIYLKPE